MPAPGVALEKLGFLTIGTFDGDDPAPGHEHLLAEIELAEQLGFDSVWLRHRHLQYGVSSPVTLLAAASQRTSRIEFGTAVTPLGWENPLRYAEDLGTLDILSGGRMNPGISVGPPMHWDDVKGALYPDTADAEDFTYERVARLHRLLRGEPRQHLLRHRGHRVVLRPRPAALPRARRPALVRRGQRELRASGRGAGAEPAHVQRRAGRARRGAGLRRHPGRFDPGVPGRTPGRGRGPGLAGPRRDPDRHRDRRAAREVRGLRRGPHPADRLARRDRAGCCSPGTSSGPRRRSPRRCTRTPASARRARSCSRCRSPSPTRTTCRSSPTWRRGSGRRWDGAGRRGA